MVLQVIGFAYKCISDQNTAEKGEPVVVEEDHAGKKVAMAVDHEMGVEERDLDIPVLPDHDWKDIAAGVEPGGHKDSDEEDNTDSS